MTTKRQTSRLALHAIVLETSDDLPLADRLPSAARRSVGIDEIPQGTFHSHTVNKAVGKVLELGHADLQRVDDEIQTVLARLKPRPGAKYGLSELQVGIALTAQGGIGIVTAGVQASLTLVYSVVEPKT